MVDEGAMPSQPRKLHRSDWSTISVQLRRYYDDLVKTFEPEATAFFDRVMMKTENIGALE